MEKIYITDSVKGILIIQNPPVTVINAPEVLEPYCGDTGLRSVEKLARLVNRLQKAIDCLLYKTLTSSQELSLYVKVSQRNSALNTH